MLRLSTLILAISLTSSGMAQGTTPSPIEITTTMVIDVDGAPNAYGPKGKPTLDVELNAHVKAQASGKIVGYLTKDDGKTPEVQGPNDPFPGYYISTTGFHDKDNLNLLDPKRYLDASKVNYVVFTDWRNPSGMVLDRSFVVNKPSYRRARVLSCHSDVPLNYKKPHVVL